MCIDCHDVTLKRCIKPVGVDSEIQQLKSSRRFSNPPEHLGDDFPLLLRRMRFSGNWKELGGSGGGGNKVRNQK